MSYSTLITTLGQAKIAAAIASASTVNLFEMALGDGDGNPTTPDQAQTELVREVHRAQLNDLKTDPNNPNYLIAELVVPTDVGGWTVREVGLFDEDGALIAVGNFPDTYKPLLAEGAARDLVVRMVIEVADTGVVTLTIDPAVVLASRQWVTDNFTLAIVLPGGNTGEVLRKASNADGDFEWWDPTSGANILVTTVNEQQTLTAAQTAVTLAICTTTGVAVYVEGVRLFPDDYSIVDATHLTLATSYPAGSQILFVQNDPLSSFDFLEVSQNLAEIAAAGSAAQEAAVANLGFDANATFLALVKDTVFQTMYPIGEILTTRQEGSPDTWLGFGTWERYGAGKALVGYDSADAAFNALDKTGGAKTHALTAGEMPAHVHSVDPPITDTSFTEEKQNILFTGGSSSFVNSNNGTGTPTNGLALQTFSTEASRPLLETDGGNHKHTVNIAAFNSASAGGGTAHNNLQPYITIYIWKRTA